MAKVSVIIPAYNIEDYIGECLKSVLNQTLNDIEIIIINDGSTDKTLEKINRVINNDKRVKVINQKNRGLIETRRVGLKNASSEFILFIDGDDYIELNALEELYNTAVREKCDILQFDYYYKYEDKKIRAKNINHNICEGDEFLRGILLGSIGVNVWSKFIRRDLLNKIVWTNNITLGEDLFIIFSLSLQYPKVCFIEKPLYYYRVRENSISRMNNSNLKDLEKVIEIIEKNLKKEYMYDNYKQEFQFLVFNHIYCNRIVANKYIDSYHKELYEYWKKKNININNNKYIRQYIKTVPLLGKIGIKLYEINYTLASNMIKVMRCK